MGAAVSAEGGVAAGRVLVGGLDLLPGMSQPASGAALTRLQRRVRAGREAATSATASTSVGWWFDIMAGASSKSMP